jgi:hypothetical protein
MPSSSMISLILAAYHGDVLPIEITIDIAEMANKRAFQRPYLAHDTADARVRRRVPRQRRERSRIGTDPPPEPADSVQAGNGSRSVPRAVVQTTAAPADEIGQIDEPGPPTTFRAQEPPKIPVSFIEPDCNTTD